MSAMSIKTVVSSHTASTPTPTPTPTPEVPQTTNFSPQLQSCVVEEISAVGCHSVNWPCFCDNPTWVSNIAQCVTLDQRGTSGFDIITLSSAYCRYASNLYTTYLPHPSTMMAPPPVIYDPGDYSTASSTTASTSPASKTAILNTSAPETSAVLTPTLPRAQSGGISRSFVLGLAVGIPFSLLFATALTSLLCIHQQRRRRRAEIDNHPRQNTRSSVQDLWARMSGTAQGAMGSPIGKPPFVARETVFHEMDGSDIRRSEMWTSANIAEMSVEKRVVELSDAIEHESSHEETFEAKNDR
ncbi:hypothetical protein BU26DRAFT_234068 [Trematosphaeria pertusa]|uniref:CFEM domain-containing protein n=1 Tax=Trematosphaeria pertusa TaxID=390896 RepID=A0A6A6IUC1_9PLEO|nr:uncharacterized protein BU26DRAFT_234068 [Trematosphaeria pertusa]KAF2254016.1 hypothetical protein BU26DRAFT_234068 [Trematosphaeria pertusa]